MHTILFILVLIGTLAAVAFWTYRVSRNNIRRALARCDARAAEDPSKARRLRARKIFAVVGEILSTLAWIP